MTNNPTTVPLYQALASLVDAYRRCETTGNETWELAHHERILNLCKAHMPHGSGLDAGMFTCITLGGTLSKVSTPELLVFPADFHHMDDNGSYDGWTSHTVEVRPSLQHGISLKVTGRDRNDVKAYIADVFLHALMSEV